MAEKNKPLCKWPKSGYTKDLKKLTEIVQEPRFICKDCGRAAREKKWLCKSVKI